MSRGGNLKAKSIILCSILSLFALDGFSSTWKMATYNIRNFKSNREGRGLSSTDLEKLKSIIKETQADIIGVQEIVDHDGFKKFVEKELQDYKVIIEICGGSGRQNLGFIYKRTKFRLKKVEADLSVTLGSSCKNGLRPALIADFYWKPGKMDVRFVGLHLKAGGDDDDKERRYQQFKVIGDNILKYYKNGIKNIVIMGDLNTTDYILKDVYYRKFKYFLRKTSMKDYARDTECTSYWKKFKNDPARYSSKLDHILVSKNLAAKHPYVESESQAHCYYNSCEPAILEDLGESYEKVSDHCPVVSSLSL